MVELTGWAILAIFPICMIFATFYDLFTMTIPNRVVLALLAAFVICAPLAGMGLQTAFLHVAVALVVLAVGFVLFNIGVMGGGDAKLLAVSALWFGTAFTVPYLFAASILGGILTFIIIVARRASVPKKLQEIGWINRLLDANQGVPYGAALGPAALLVFADTPWFEFIATGKLLS